MVYVTTSLFWASILGKRKSKGKSKSKKKVQEAEKSSDASNTDIQGGSVELSSEIEELLEAKRRQLLAESSSSHGDSDTGGKFQEFVEIIYLNIFELCLI